VCGLYRPGESLSADSSGKMETEHPLEGPFGREFSSIYIVSELWGPEIGIR